MKVTKRELVFKRPYSALPEPESDVIVPAGSQVELASPYYPDKFWVDHRVFPWGSSEKHDAYYRGFLVEPEDVEEK